MRSNRIDAAQWRALVSAIEEKSGERINPASAASVSGGCIHTSLSVQSTSRRLFLKVNRQHLADGLAAEQTGLQALAATGTVRVPEPLCSGVAGGLAFLAMEWLDLSSHADNAAQRQLGLSLAALHEASASRFGFHSDNMLGATAQPNAWCETWPEFLRDYRLGFQLRLAAQNGFRGELREAGDSLLARLSQWKPERFQPALLHGDLWGGNWGVLADGVPVVFDPAVFYGDPESDIAMTRLFGGFGKAFYEGYRSVHPEPPDGELRRQLYTLYHVLNHLNLFGGGYLGQALALLRSLRRAL